jgi:DNA-binding GntR family transcriptional regulator
MSEFLTASGSSSLSGSRETLATSVYVQLRADLLRGALPPDSRLRVERLIATYGAGASPIREALNRLASEGLLVRHDQRGFFVVPVSRPDLGELTRTRCWLEERALRESIAHRTQEWEDAIVLSLHRLSRTPRLRGNEAHAANPEWEKLHREFHQNLISACRSRWLMGFCNQLADHAFRYRQIARIVAGAPRDELAEHRTIAERAIDGDADGAVAALTDHYQLTCARCMPGLAEIDVAPPSARRRTARGAPRTAVPDDQQAQ